MKVEILISLILILLILPACARISSTERNPEVTPVANSSFNDQTIKLPQPRLKSDFSIEEALLMRRSIREYSTSPLNLEDVSQLLWAAQGVTSQDGGRTAPSAGALYPLEVYLVTGKVTGIVPGIYHYLPEGHEMSLRKSGDFRNAVSQAALGQTAVSNGAVDIVISAVYERTTLKYGERGIRYAQIETGHAAQNLCLQAQALNLGAVTIGAFDDDQVKTILGLPDNETPLYIIPVGKALGN